MLALSLVAVALLAILSVYSLGLRQSSYAERILKATESAKELLESTGELSFDQIPDTNVQFDGRVNSPVHSPLFPPEPYPERDGQPVLVIVDQLGPSLKSVCVKVFYEKGRSVDLQTYFRPE